jgi:hypothetical protein
MSNKPPTYGKGYKSHNGAVAAFIRLPHEEQLKVLVNKFDYPLTARDETSKRWYLRARYIPPKDWP